MRVQIYKTIDNICEHFTISTHLPPITHLNEASQKKAEIEFNFYVFFGVHKKVKLIKNTCSFIWEAAAAAGAS